MSDYPELALQLAKALQRANGVRVAAEWEDESDGNKWDYVSMARAGFYELIKAGFIPVRKQDLLDLMVGTPAHVELAQRQADVRLTAHINNLIDLMEQPAPNLRESDK